jgi:outer membrane protein insertion porin family/translocation and assembly module TamA
VSYFFADRKLSAPPAKRVKLPWSRLLVGALAAAAWLIPARALAQDGERAVRKLSFEGNKAIDDATLAASIATSNSSWFARTGLVRWIGVGSEKYVNERELQRDVLRIEVLYRRSGFPAATVDTIIKRTPGDIYITFKVTEGTPIRLEQLTFLGLDSLPPGKQKEVTQDLPLRVGKPFNLARLQMSIDTVKLRLRNQGYPMVDVFREFTSDSATRKASATLTVVPGHHFAFGSVKVEGTTRVDTSVVRSLLAVESGRPFSEKEITASQLNLYRSDLFSLAQVSLDTAVFDQADSLVPIIVKVAEARRRTVRASAGYASQDCFRVSAGFGVRNFLGSGRILDISARASKIGVASSPGIVDWNLENSLCPGVKEDGVVEIGSRKLNYNVTVSVRRPAFLSPQNSMTLSGFSERRSEYSVYLREDIGTGVALTRESPVRRDPLTVAYTFSYGATQATAAAFCSYFSVCTPEVRAAQELRKPLAILSATASFPRVNNPVDPTRGQLFTGEVAWSSSLIGSSQFQQFTRLAVEGRWYRTILPDVVLAWRVRAGRVFGRNNDNQGTVNFVPVEQRFYAGGPNDVRGFPYNQLGPIVYVIPDADTAGYATDPAVLDDHAVPFATGGNVQLIGNVEVRFPAPIGRGRLRLAAFVDMGGVWQTDDPVNSEKRLVATPGMGLRLVTPVGPLRFDVAYSWNKLQRGTVYVSNTDTEDLTELRPVPGGPPLTFQPINPGGWQLNLTVGQPF